MSSGGQECLPEDLGLGTERQSASALKLSKRRKKQDTNVLIAKKKVLSGLLLVYGNVKTVVLKWVAQLLNLFLIPTQNFSVYLNNTKNDSNHIQ